jgi:hypothetical protein
MTDPEIRQQAIDAMTQVIQQAEPDGSISEEDARQAATMAVDAAIRQRGEAG